MQNKYAAIVVAVGIVALLVVFGFQLLGQAADQGGSQPYNNCINCARCTQVCINNTCLPSGMTLCPDSGRCVIGAAYCNCSQSCDPCLKTCTSDGHCVPQNPAMKYCPDGRCVSNISSCESCDPPCAWCTQECSNGNCVSRIRQVCPDGTCIPQGTTCETCLSSCDPCTQKCSGGSCVDNTEYKRCSNGACISKWDKCPPIAQPVAT